MARHPCNLPAMKFFLTDDVPDMETELRRLGHEVVGGPAERVTAICAGSGWGAKDYNPLPFVQRLRPDVCLFVGPLRTVPVGFPVSNGERGYAEFGYHRSHIVNVKGTGNCIAVGLARVGDDPEVTRRYRQGKCPGCTGGPQSFAMWATADAGTAAEVARERRCALWRPGEGGAAGLIAALEDIRRRGQYRGGVGAQPYV